jgi:hypothetical protein
MIVGSHFYCFQFCIVSSSCISLSMYLVVGAAGIYMFGIINFEVETAANLMN